MNKLAMLFFVLHFNISSAQENTAFVDSILHLVGTNQIQIFNEAYKKINNSNIRFVRTDTVVNCLWTRPKYIDNIRQGAIDGTIVKQLITYDTSTNQKNKHFLAFKTSEYDEILNENLIKVIFQIDKRQKKHESSDEILKIHSDFRETLWRNEEITINGNKVTLDSCHATYRIQFNSDFTFKQFYGDHKSSCRTENMHEKIEVSIEGALDMFYEFSYRLQGHYIRHSNGYWQIENNTLYLLNLQKQVRYSFFIEKYKENECVLKLINSDYIFNLKKIVSK